MSGLDGAEPVEPAGHRAGALFWISAAVGWVVIGVGLWGVLSNRLDTRPANLAKFVVGGALVHDLLFAPLVLLGAVALARVVPPWARATVVGALVVSGTVALYAWPLVRAYGLAANNPTSLPHNYAVNLSVVLGVVWAASIAWLAARRWRLGRWRRSSGSGAASDDVDAD